MNRIYKLVWDALRQAWVVVSECCRARGKVTRLGRTTLGLSLAAAFGARPAFAQGLPPATLPTHGQVTSGRAEISSVGSAMTIRQSTDKAIVQWQGFSIGSAASVRFVQPDAGSVALNRVIGADASVIAGQLLANGQVFLVNPAGILFSSSARVDVGGLVASTMAIRDDDFLAGRYTFSREPGSGAVVNQGELLGRYVALLAPEVRNEGLVSAPMGTAVLAGGEVVRLGLTGDRRVSVEVDRATIDTLVENRHLVHADGGAVVLSAQSARDLLGRVVNTGAISANGISTDGGTVRLVASSVVEHAGTISVDGAANGKGGTALLIADVGNAGSRTALTGSISARGGSQAGDGGFVETSAARLQLATDARVDTTAPEGRAGQWLLDPFDFTIAAANGDITGAALSSALGSSNVTIRTTDTSVNCTAATCGSGTSTGNGDIFVNDSVSWTANTTLTLSAWRNIAINAPISVAGAGGSLSLEFAQSDTQVNLPSGTYQVNAPVNLAAGAGFSTKAASDGTPVVHTVIRDAAALASISANLAGNYVLGSDVAAPVTSWTPLGSTATPFTGTFDGLGHKVTGLVHTNAGADVDVGLFGGSTGLIQNVGVTGVNIAGSQNVGALVGFNNGFVVNSYATGVVSGTTSVAGSVGRIGGLVGFSMGPIQGSYAHVAVSATGGDQVGDPMADGKGGVGGLAGVVGTSVQDSYARGSVSGGNAVGGLVGYSGAAISNSYSTGAVTGNTNVNGLVGQVTDPASVVPFIFGSFWDTESSGQLTGGGGGADSVTGLSTAGMRTVSNFTAAGWDTSAWELRSGQYPLLKQMLQPIFLIADNKSVTAATPFTGFTSTISPAGAPASAYSGTPTYTPSALSSGGTYLVLPGGVSVTAPGDQHGYRIAPVGGVVTLTANAASVLELTSSTSNETSASLRKTVDLTVQLVKETENRTELLGQGGGTTALQQQGKFVTQLKEDLVTAAGGCAGGYVGAGGGCVQPPDVDCVSGSGAAARLARMLDTAVMGHSAADFPHETADLFGSSPPKWQTERGELHAKGSTAFMSPTPSVSIPPSASSAPSPNGQSSYWTPAPTPQPSAQPDTRTGTPGSPSASQRTSTPQPGSRVRAQGRSSQQQSSGVTGTTAARQPTPSARPGREEALPTTGTSTAAQPSPSASPTVAVPLPSLEPRGRSQTIPATGTSTASQPSPSAGPGQQPSSPRPSNSSLPPC